MPVKVLPIVNDNKLSAKVDLDFHNFELAPQLGDVVRFTNKVGAGAPVSASGRVAWVEHQGVPINSEEPSCIMIWIELLTS